MNEPALAIENLGIVYQVRGLDRPVIRDLSFAIAAGEAYGLVGESGCGKSTVAFAVMRYLAANGRVKAGAIRVAGEDVLALGGEKLRRYRAASVSMVYQNPGLALNPTMRIGDQLIEAFEVAGASPVQARTRALDMLTQVRLADPAGVMGRFAHQLSGGMQQRVVIAMALASRPGLLILDEPTTGLDVTVEAEVLDLIEELRRATGASLLYISHNLGLVARLCDRVGVLYAGQLLEEGPTREVFRHPRHPYGVGLLRCLPRGERDTEGHGLDTINGFLPPLGASITGCVFGERCGLARAECLEKAPPLTACGPGRLSRCFRSKEAADLPRVEEAPPPASSAPADRPPLLQLTGISKTFHQGDISYKALNDVALTIREGETVGLVGESGSGKTTLARVISGLTKPDPGAEILFEGRPLSFRIADRDQTQVGAIQVIFQNPDAALNRRFSVYRILNRAIKRLRGGPARAREERLFQLLNFVRFDQNLVRLVPSNLSGGLKQRVAIARAFAGRPRLVICDEPTSALDVSVQAAILNLLVRLQREQGVTYIFISHDLGVVRYIADRIAVLYLGHLLEFGPAERIFSSFHHPYTEALLSARPTLEKENQGDRLRLAGDIPNPGALPPGCVFQTRCPRKTAEMCVERRPELREVRPGHFLSCHLSDKELGKL